MTNDNWTCPQCGGYTDESPIPYQKARLTPGYECNCPCGCCPDCTCPGDECEECFNCGGTSFLNCMGIQEVCDVCQGAGRLCQN